MATQVTVLPKSLPTVVLEEIARETAWIRCSGLTASGGSMMMQSKDLHFSLRMEGMEVGANFGSLSFMMTVCGGCASIGSPSGIAITIAALAMKDSAAELPGSKVLRFNRKNAIQEETIVVICQHCTNSEYNTTHTLRLAKGNQL